MTFPQTSQDVRPLLGHSCNNPLRQYQTPLVFHMEAEGLFFSARSSELDLAVSDMYGHFGATENASQKSTPRLDRLENPPRLLQLIEIKILINGYRRVSECSDRETIQIVVSFQAVAMLGRC